MAVKKAALACTVCGSRNYSIAASKNRTQRLELKKFCKHCGKQTLHKETRQEAMFKFIKSVNQTMAKVSWPTWKQNRRDTGVVIISSILFGAYLGLLDLLFSYLTQMFL